MLILPMPLGAFQPPKPAAAYGCKRLLYFEGYEDIRKAIAREKQLKGLAARKEAQPHSHDLSRVQRPCTDLGMEDDYSS
jgi:hypothetical protein